MPNLDSWNTSITEIANGVIKYRGSDIDGQIEAGELSGVLWQLLFATNPTIGQADALRRALIAALDHGVAAPSTLTARAIASTRSSIPFAIAGGLIAFAGPAHGGAAEESAKLFIKVAGISEGNLHDQVLSVVRPLLEKGERIPGYGHPYHAYDPRVPALLRGVEDSSRHREIAKEFESVVGELTGKKLSMNADSAVAALLLDVGLQPGDVTLITALGRSFGLAAHAREEQANEKPFRAPGLHTVFYDENIDLKGN